MEKIKEKLILKNDYDESNICKEFYPKETRHINHDIPCRCPKSKKVRKAFRSLNKLKKLLQMHKMPTVALGDFNVNTEEDSELFIYNDQEDLWGVAHLIGCADCKGTYYYSYGKSWSFLDTIFVSKQRNISYDTDSIRLHITEHNAYKDSGKPIRFNAKSKTGVSDHLPMVARIKIN